MTTKMKIIFSFLLIFLLSEISLRAILHKRTPTAMIFDDKIIYSFKPNSTAFDHKLNSLGCIGDDFSSDSYKILLLGESTSFSSEYVAVTKKNIIRKEPVEVMSCGRPRYTSYINNINFEKNLIKLKPDVIGIYMGINDNIYNTFYWIDADKGELPDVGFFNYKSIVPVTYSLIKYHLIDKLIFSTPNFKDKKTLNSEAIFKKNTEEIIELAKKNNIKVVLLKFVESSKTSDPLLSQKIKNDEKIMQHFWGTVESTAYGVSEHNQILEALAKKYHLPISSFDDSIPKTSEYFKDICHLTTKGNSILGEAMAKLIMDALLGARSAAPTTSL